MENSNRDIVSHFTLRSNQLIVKCLRHDLELTRAALNAAAVFGIFVKMRNNSASVSRLSGRSVSASIAAYPALMAMFLLCCGNLLAQGVGAYQPYANQPYTGQAYGDQVPSYQSQPYDSAWARQPLSAGQLEQLVAPIALYPDALVAQVLAASTYPGQVAEADRWWQGQGYATGEQVAYGADVQPWDPSVKALTAFPRVLDEMARNLQWTTDLGNAYYNQPQDVLEAVQVMRRRAEAAGTLRSGPQELVRYDAGMIQLVPADPQVVYVPEYNPWTVYGDPVSPYPGFSLLGDIGQFLGSTVLRYGLGIAVSSFTRPWSFLAWGLDWLAHALLFHDSAYSSNSTTVADWGFPHRRFYAYSGHGGWGWARDSVRASGGQAWGGQAWGGAGWRRQGAHDAGWGGEAWRSGAENSSGWHSFGRGQGLHAENRLPSRGFESFRSERTAASSFRDRSFSGSSFSNMDGRTASRMPEGRDPYRSAYAGGVRSERGSGGKFARSSFDGRSLSSSSRAERKSGGLHLFGGHSQKSVKSDLRARNDFGGGHGGLFHGGGKAPKSFRGGKAPKGFGKAPKLSGGGKGFGGGHSHGGGHSGGGKHH